jgi:hypothetical protein
LYRSSKHHRDNHGSTIKHYRFATDGPGLAPHASFPIFGITLTIGADAQPPFSNRLVRGAARQISIDMVH